MLQDFPWENWDPGYPLGPLDAGIHKLYKLGGWWNCCNQMLGLNVWFKKKRVTRVFPTGGEDADVDGGFEDDHRKWPGDRDEWASRGHIAKNLASGWWSDVDQSQGCAAEEGRLLLDLCYRTHNAGDAQEEAPLFVTDRSVRIGVGKPVPLVCGSTGKTGEWVTKLPAALFGCVGAGHRNAATARGI